MATNTKTTKNWSKYENYDLSTFFEDLNSKFKNFDVTNFMLKIDHMPGHSWTLRIWRLIG